MGLSQKVRECILLKSLFGVGGEAGRGHTGSIFYFTNNSFQADNYLFVLLKQYPNVIYSNTFIHFQRQRYEKIIYPFITFYIVFY